MFCFVFFIEFLWFNLFSLILFGWWLRFRVLALSVKIYFKNVSLKNVFYFLHFCMIHKTVLNGILKETLPKGFWNLKFGAVASYWSYVYTFLLVKSVIYGASFLTWQQERKWNNLIINWLNLRRILGKFKV